MASKNVIPEGWSIVLVIIGIALVFFAFWSGVSNLLTIGFILIISGLVHLVTRYKIQNEETQAKKKNNHFEKIYENAYETVTLFFSVAFFLFILIAMLTNPEFREEPGIPVIILFSLIGFSPYLAVKVIVIIKRKFRKDK